MVFGRLEDGNESTTEVEVRPQVSPEVPAFAPADEAEPAVQQPSEEAPPEGSQAPQTMSAALLEEYDYDRPKRGDVRQGAVLSIEPTEIVIDIGAKRECIVLASDYQKLGDEAVSRIHVGDEVTVYIVKPESREGHLIGSLYLAQMEVDWNRAEELERSGEIFEGRVTGQNRGGVLVPFGRLRGFVPASHVIGAGSNSGDQAQLLSRWVGKTLPFKVIEVNRRRNRLILSHRAARRQWRSQQKQHLLESLSEGDVRHGVVSSLASFGAFVDLGGADGLIHVSELAWYRVDHPGDLLSVGEDVEVYVLRVDRERGRIGLSLKRLQRDPWDLVGEKYEPGQLVEGRITKLVDFGAFVELEKGIEGLIHITELADPTPVRPEEIVMPGEEHLLRVLRVEAESRRIGLSYKAVGLQEREEWEDRRDAAAMAAAAGDEGEPAPPAAEEPVGEAQSEAAEGEDQVAAEVTDQAEGKATQGEDQPAAEGEATQGEDQPAAEAEDQPAAEAEATQGEDQPAAEAEAEDEADAPASGDEAQPPEA